MKLFAILGFALAASSVANGLALKGARLSVQAQQQQQESLADLSQQEEIQAPTPYQFSYDTKSEGSQQSRSEQGDASGRVIGQYTIKDENGAQRIVSYTADSEGFRANITTNEPGTESQNPSFIVLQSSQLPAAEISRQLQTEVDLQQQEESPVEEAELPAAPVAPVKAVSAPRKVLASAPTKSVSAPRKAPAAPVRQAAVSVPVSKGGRRQQTAAVQPSKRTVAAASPAKGAVRSRGPSKSLASSTTQRPQMRAAAQPSKRPQQQQAPQVEAEQSEDAQLTLSADQSEGESALDDSQEGF